MNDLRFVTGLNSSEEIIYEQKLAHEKTTQSIKQSISKAFRHLKMQWSLTRSKSETSKQNTLRTAGSPKKRSLLTVKAYRLVKNNLEDLDELLDMVEALRGKV